MQPIYKYLLFAALCWSIAGCYKDKGNYDYQAINELTIRNLDTVQGYSVDLGQVLTVSPQIIGTQDTDGTSRPYKYEWSIDFPVYDSVISTEKNLSVKMTMAPGSYTLLFRVIDEVTGVRFQKRAPLLVSTSIFEGYMVLSDVNGHARLDMIPYTRATNTFKVIPDVLAYAGSTFPQQGKPLQVFCMDKNAFFDVKPNSYRIYILTETGTSWVNPETFAYGPLDNIRYEMTGNIPANFKATRMGGEVIFGLFPGMTLVSGNEVYTRLSDAPNFPYAACNIYPGAAKPFKAHPQVIIGGLNMVVFNMDKRTFTSGFFSAVSLNDMAPGLNYPTGKDLVHMEYDGSGSAYAILKDPGVQQYYLLRFVPGAEVTYFEPLNATDIASATQFAVSPQFGYLFYSAGGKLYEYDLSLKQSFLMADKGNSVISHLSFQRFYNSSRVPKYAEWSRLLTVGSYNPAQEEGKNGTIELYNILPVNEQITLANSWTGFGKVTSVSFRER
ncbi:PKD-like family lipoprotein [Parasegetibacter sp. NRK P23]|uniref:PKD-like family lipoprotein n=1 Tax=Parasegetibacter sp. NRK P23 TaxID=2942999 RepID=UPI0020440A70|nr:PKD-like family lipoprotein [Parasegetibacter sp. NRK P23]MCM5528418.1 PKD-like family lipoprotein [Parasegetibacter sp. NRK P23]